MKFLGKMGRVTGNRRLDFGDCPIHDADSGFFKVTIAGQGVS